MGVKEERIESICLLSSHKAVSKLSRKANKQKTNPRRGERWVYITSLPKFETKQRVSTHLDSPKDQEEMKKFRL